MLLDCPFCHHDRAFLSKRNQETRSGASKDIYTCEECGLLYPRPRMDHQESKTSIAMQHTNQDAFEFVDPLRPIYQDDYIARLLKKHTSLKGDALDIGAFDGRFCHILESMGYRSYGIEVQEKVAQYARQNGLRVFSGAFPDMIPKEFVKMKFNLITVMEAIYYLVDLRKSILKITDMLEESGHLLIKYHQGNSRYYDQKSCFSRYGDTVQGIPTVSSMKYCLEKSGFRIVCIQGEDLPDLMPWGIGSMRDGFPKKVFAKIYNSLMLHYTLIGINRADRITVLAEKSGKT